MSNLSASTYTVDEIHKMRVRVAEQYKAMSPDEAERDFRAHVENAKRTMDALRKATLAWDPDFSKVTREEAERIRAAEESGFIPESEIDWDEIGQ